MELLTFNDTTRFVNDQRRRYRYSMHVVPSTSSNDPSATLDRLALLVPLARLPKLGDVGVAVTTTT